MGCSPTNTAYVCDSGGKVAAEPYCANLTVINYGAAAESKMTYLRRLPKFEYFAPRSVADACAFLAAHSSEAKLLAGGTDLIMQMRRRDVAPRYIIGLKNTAGLNFIREEAGGALTIGAMTTVATLHSSPVIRKRYGILSRTAFELASPEVRQLATIGGNVSGALPCADLPPALLVLDAKIKLESTRGARLVPMDEFFLTFEQTVKAADEILTEFQIPAASPHSDGVYLKFHDRHSMDMTTLGVSACVTADRQLRIMQDIKIALATAAPLPLRARKTEAALRGQPFSEKAVEEAAALVLEEADPRDSWRASRAFRLRLLTALTKRAVTQAWQRAVSNAEGGRA
jgi:carbon-monoxide dehydrogenase medium subunit